MASAAMSSALQSGAGAINKSRENSGVLAKLAPSSMLGQAEKIDELEQDPERVTANIMQTVRAVAGAMIGIAVLVIVLNEVFSIDAIANGTGEFSGVLDSLRSTGSAALGLIVVGLLVLAANRVMSFFGGGGF